MCSQELRERQRSELLAGSIKPIGEINIDIHDAALDMNEKGHRSVRAMDDLIGLTCCVHGGV
jgi:hypothetical protein